ncbi:hypothetical protein NL676_032755 [Syzygium grande]|nr:hypothetical protein NL676_032755 [Syzygium grande]
MESKFTELTYSVDDVQADSLTYSANPDHFPYLSDGFNANELYVDCHSSEVDSLLHEQEPTNHVPIVPIILDGELNRPSTEVSPDGGLPLEINSLLHEQEPTNHVPIVPIILDGELHWPSTEVSTNGGLLNNSTSFSDMPNLGGESLSLSDYRDSPDPVLKYINQILMEEEIEERPWIIPDMLALRQTEKSLYDTLGKEYPNSPEQNIEFNANQFINGSSNNSRGSSREQGSNGTSHSVDPDLPDDPEETQYYAPLRAPNPCEVVAQWTVDPISHFYMNTSSGLPDYWDEFGDTFPSELLLRRTLSNSQLQFNRGSEEARKFLPASVPLTVDQENYNLAHKIGNTEANCIDEEENMRNHLENEWRGRKNHYRDDVTFEEGQANKQSALYKEDCELSEMFDKVLLIDNTGGLLSLECTSEKTSQSKDLPGPNCRRGSRQKKSTADLRSLLVRCAQAVSASDFKTAHELLKQIRHDSSPSGDGSQRLAHYFAKGLEARLAVSIDRNQAQGCYRCFELSRTVADELKAYQLHLSACPFTKFQIIFAKFMILKFAAAAKVLHIIDFGINFGFQWPLLIQELSKRTEGAPKLRITGIDLPQSGFRPAEKIEETGRRLANCCERFNVPFEFHAVASGSWECIRIEDLKIRSGEMVAVNCLSRLKYLYDETVEVNCQRDAVLRLIRSMKPNVFVHGIHNGSYNMPFFLTRFREALFHISAVYDMFDATVAGDNEQRLVLERDFYGREIMNVVACEGLHRVERPETYRQWQVRLTRAGFKQLPLDQELMKKARAKLRKCYHKDFGLDEESNWMLLGWKGRIISGSTCWEST